MGTVATKSQPLSAVEAPHGLPTRDINIPGWYPFSKQLLAHTMWHGCLSQQPL